VARLGVLDGVGDELRELSDPVLGPDRHLEDLGGRWLARDQNGHTLQRRVLANELLERPAARGSVHRPTLTEVVESAAMSRVVVINHLTLDGVMQGPGRPDEDTRDGFDLGGWAGANVDDVVNAAVGARRPQSGGMLLGRRSYEDMLGYWNTQDSPFKDMLNDAPKYVASRTLSEPLPWPNSTLLTGGVAESVAQLKQESGRDLNVMGSGELIRR
jgi:dihydrofolate reductase